MAASTYPLTSEEADLIFPISLTDFTLLEDQRQHPKSVEAVKRWPGGKLGLGVDRNPFRFHDATTATKEFLERLRVSWSIADLCEDLLLEVTPSLRSTVSEAVERAYWNEHGSVLLHPWVHRLVNHLQDAGGGGVLHQVNYAGWRLQVCTLSQATSEHPTWRIGVLAEGMRGADPFHVAAGEFLIDYLYVQRALAEDVRVASRRKGAFESTAARLNQIDHGYTNHRDRARFHISFSDRIANLSRDFGTREKIDTFLAYAHTRRIPEEGVLVRFASEANTALAVTPA